MTETDWHRWLSCLSHEIRNPLTLVYSSLQILEKEYPDVSTSPLWGQTLDDIQYLIRLLKDSSAALREYQPDFTVFSVHQLLQELILSAGALFAEQNIQMDSRIIRGISDSFDADTDLLIRADRTRLKEALTNLLVNAADALSSMPASHERRLCLYAILSDTEPRFSSLPDTDGSPLERSAAGSAICFHVRDNGPGIPEEYLDTLFDPFVTHKSNGTGLGLSIVRNIAGLHGGTISVEARTDTGSSFTDFCLCIPCFFAFGDTLPAFR